MQLCLEILILILNTSMLNLNDPTLELILLAFLIQEVMVSGKFGFENACCMYV